MLNPADTPTTQFPEDMDPECIALCSAINRVPGVETVESCCGHRRERFRVWVKTRTQYDLSPVLFQLLYAGPQWEARVKTDGTMMPVTFCIVGPIIGAEGTENLTADGVAIQLNQFVDEHKEELAQRGIAPTKVVRQFARTTGDTKRVSLRMGHYGHNLGFFAALFELAKVDFPWLVMGDVNVVLYGGVRINGYWGIEFNTQAEIPDGYEHVDQLEITY